MNFVTELIVYHSIRIFGSFIRALPLSWALAIGKFIGILAYFFDTRHRALAYSNLQVAFSHEKSPDEIKKITRNIFTNYGQNIIELLRLPLLTKTKFNDIVTVEGKDNLDKSLEQGKGVILLAMHFGSWEIASVTCAMLGYPYKVLVNPQTKHSRLDELLNSLRMCGGTVVLSRGMDNREFIRSLKNNEVIGMVVDQGGRDGMLVPFFGRKASMSVGAIRVGLKWGVPLCFAIIIREKNGRHRMVFSEPIELDKESDIEKSVEKNLRKVTLGMEDYIRKFPSEYMWFYKIWKYSNEVNIVILSDGKTGHVRQSETVAKNLQKALLVREIQSTVRTVEVRFKNEFCSKLLSLLSIFFNPLFCQGRIGFLQWFLTAESFKSLTSQKAEFIISCGSSVCGINYLFSQDFSAKSIAILKTGLMPFKKFQLVILPQHDFTVMEKDKYRVISTVAAPNLISPEYLQEQRNLLIQRFPCLQGLTRMKIGVFIGGDSKNVDVKESQVRVLIDQLLEVAQNIPADLLLTTSRRTSSKIEEMLNRELRKNPRCQLLVIANKENVPEAVGGILAVSDVVVVSGDSISMVSEAASSGKNTIVFQPFYKMNDFKKNKHYRFIEKLHSKGYIFSTDVKDLGRCLYDVSKGKLRTKVINDNVIISEALRFVI